MANEFFDIIQPKMVDKSPEFRRNTPMRFDDFVQMLQQVPYSEMAEIEKVTGVPFSTIRNIRSEITTNPGIRTVETIQTYFQKGKK